MKSILELCYEDYLKKGTGVLKIIRDDGNISYDDPNKWFCPDFKLSELDINCLSKLRKGTILDIGCGTGVHLRYLQKLGKEVYGFDISKFSIELAKKLGAVNVYEKSFWDYNPTLKFDNAICMNGSMGFIGEIEKLNDFFKKCREFLKEEGYLYLQGVDWRVDPTGKHEHYVAKNIANKIYPGTVIFHHEYGDVIEEEFKWVWIDTDTLIKTANKNGFELVELIFFNAKYFIILKMKSKN